MSKYFTKTVVADFEYEVSDGDHANPKPARPRSTRDVFVYFDNDAKVFAPRDAQALAQRVDKLLTR